LKSAAPKAERPRRSFLELEQIAAVLRAANLIEVEHRGPTWEGVELIRRSNRSALSLARELGISDTLVRKVRRGELWNGMRGPRNRNDVPRRVIVETLTLAGPRISELCGLNCAHLDITGDRLRMPRSATKTDAGERTIPIVPASTSDWSSTESNTRAARGSQRSPHGMPPVRIQTTSVRAFSRRFVHGPTSCSRTRAAYRFRT
jgi:integrase